VSCNKKNLATLVGAKVLFGPNFREKATFCQKCIFKVKKVFHRNKKNTLRIPSPHKKVASSAGLPDFLGPKYQNGGKYTKLPQNIPNGHKIFPMA
jgi:hypothetical protein